MDFLELTNDEIRQIVNDIFQPKKISCIKKSKEWDEITCKIYTKWESVDDSGKIVVDLIGDTITLRNPFNYGKDAIEADFRINKDDYDKLKQFCYAKGIYGESIEWLVNNPYMKQNSEDNVENELFRRHL